MSTILVVDDEPAIVELLTEILEAAILDGYGLYRELQAIRPALCRRVAFIAARTDAVKHFRPLDRPDPREAVRRGRGSGRRATAGGRRGVTWPSFDLAAIDTRVIGGRHRRAL